MLLRINRYYLHYKVLHGGEVVEYDEPHLLLCQPTSYLGMLVDHTGNVTAQKLRAIALEKYNYRAKSPEMKHFDTITINMNY